MAPKPVKLRDVPLDFVAQRQGTTLVISAKSEWTGFPPNFGLKDIELQVPYGTTVKKVQMHDCRTRFEQALAHRPILKRLGLLFG